jgi:hypothetical protein
VPKNDKIQEIVTEQGKEDNGKEGNEKLVELLRWNWARVGKYCGIRSWHRGAGYVATA